MRLNAGGAASAQPHQIGSADFEGNATDQIRQRYSLIRTDVHRASHVAVEELRERGAHIGNMQKTAHLPSMRAERFLVLEQMADDGGHQAIRMLVRTELKKNPAPSAR
jgi:hypothetical protein